MKKLTQEEFKKKLDYLFPDNKLEIIEFSGRFKPFTVKCHNCGKITTVTRAGNFLRRQTYCDCQPSLCIQEYIKKINKILEENDNLIWLDSLTKILTPLHFKCKKCGYEFQRQANYFLKYNKCPLCDHKINTTESYKKRVEEATNGEYSLVSEYVKDDVKVLIKHNDCGFIYSITPSNFNQHGTKCPRCKRLESKGEAKIRYWLEKNNIQYEKEYRFDELARYPFDYKIIKNNQIYLIEFQGEQHYKPKKHFGGEKSFEIQQQRDKIKKEFCKEKGYNLIEIPYYDYKRVEDYLKVFIGSTTISEESTLQANGNGNNRLL